MRTFELDIADYRRTLSMIERIVASDSPESLAATIVEDVSALIPTHACGWVEIHPASGYSYGLMNVPFDPAVLASEMSRVIHGHPIFRAFNQTGDGSARAISDLVSRRTYRSSDLYCKYLKKYRSEDQLVIASELDRERITVLTINRDTWGFDAREKAILNSIRICLFQTHWRLRQLAEATLARDGIRLREMSRPALIASLKAKGLCPREAEVAARITEGATNREIAAALSLCEGTVRKHIDRVFMKLAVHNRAAATRVILSSLTSRSTKNRVSRVGSGK